MRVLYEDFIYENDAILTFNEFLELIRTKRLSVYYDKSEQNFWVKYWDEINID